MRGPLSQWWTSKFEVDGVVYNCAEQYMMAAKARLFGDHDSLEAVMSSSSPRDQKTIGRRIAGFDPNVWDAVKVDVVCRANYARARFGDARFLRSLELTIDHKLAEANPIDPVWGIAMAQDDPAALDEKNWAGENLLGKALMEVRSLYFR